MIPFSFKSPWGGANRPAREPGTARRRLPRFFGHRMVEWLEGRQLLATMTVSYSASVPVQLTDFTLPVVLPKFSPSLGTLDSVGVSFAASGTSSGTVTNQGDNPVDFGIDINTILTLSDGETQVVAPALDFTQSYSQLAGGATAPFGPFSPSQSASSSYTSGPIFDDFASGPGNINLSLQTNSSETVTGAGGNIDSSLATDAGGVATVTYTYTVAPVTLSGNVYDDVNGTGSLAAGDLPIPGTTLDLLNASGSIIATTTTAADGTYSFSTITGGGEIVPGTYSIAEVQPAGYLQGTNTVGTVNGVTTGTLTGLDVIGSIALTMGQNSIDNNFGEVKPVTVSGNVYQDLAGIGAIAPGDPPLAGVQLALENSQDVIVATTTTNSVGAYNFTTTLLGSPLPPGSYSVIETQPNGYLQGTNTVGTVNGVTTGALTAVDVIGSIALKSGQASIANNFGEILPVALTGNVYEDAKGTGSLAAGDPPIAGVVITLEDGSGNVVATTTTNPVGAYAFDHTMFGGLLVPGTYSVIETQPAGYLQATNTVGTVNGVSTGALIGVDHIGLIGLKQGQVSVNNNFGEVLPVAIGGTVYLDLAHSGVFQPGDLPIPGVTIDLYGPSGFVESTTTDATGHYAFASLPGGSPLPPASYAVFEVQPNGFLQGTNTVGSVNGVPLGTLVATDVIAGIGLKSGQVSLGNNFGELLPTPPPVVVPLHITNVQRFGVHLQPTLIVLSFDTPLDPASAQDLANYQITGPVGSKHPTTIPILAAAYNPATNLVTLQLGERLNVHATYTLTVSHLTNVSGGLLVGSNGLPGSSYVTTLNRSALSGFTDIYGNFIPIDHGKLYPAAIASGYQHKKFVEPAKLGSFAPQNTYDYLNATARFPETPPIKIHHAKKVSGKARR